MAISRNFTEGNVGSLLIRFAMPLMLSNLIQALYNAVDMYFVGNFCDVAAISSVTVCGPIMNIMIMTLSGLGVGVSIVIGAHVAEPDGEIGIRRCANTAITLFLIIALIAGTTGFILAPSIIRIIKTPEPAYAGAVLYLRTIFCGAVFMLGYNLISAMQRGLGDSRTPFFLIVSACIVNMILDYIFIGLFSMGPFGAAIATVIAQGVSFTGGIIYFRKKKHVIDFDPRHFRIDKGELNKILYMGVPAAIQQCLINISSTAVTGLANTFGLEASAAYGIMIKAESFAMMPGSAIGDAVATFSSQNVGARKPERALKGVGAAMKIDAVFSFVMLAVMYIAAPSFAAIFTDNALSIEYAVSLIRIICFSVFVLTYVQGLIGFIRGTGNSIFCLVAVVVCQYVMRIPMCYLFSRHYGLDGIAIGSISSPVIALIIYLSAIVTGRWRKSKMVTTAMDGAESST
ncbi:MAG: MATE family efflux transporter [Firmicutes bacterium]|nr:MATE family efflux transporter [Bacillota bacterium]